MRGQFIVAGFSCVALATGCSGGSGTVVPPALTGGNVAAQSSSANAPQYSVTELASLGGSVTIGGSINEQGIVAGFGLVPGDAALHAVIWRGNQITDLGTAGGPNSYQSSLNDRNFVSGFSDTSTADPLGEDFCLFGTHLICSAFAWHDGTLTTFPTLGGNNSEPLFGFNNSGQFVGASETAVHDPTCPAPQVLQVEAAVWGPGPKQVRELPPLPGDTNGQAGSMNENGDVVGGTGDCTTVYIFGGTHAVLWRQGTVIDLGSLGGAYDNTAFSVNSKDEVTGRSDLPADLTHHGFLWQNGAMSDLGTLPGDKSSESVWINDPGLIVGHSCDASRNCRAVLWRNGTIFDLNDLIQPGSPLFLLDAFGLNARGQITGFALDQNTGNIVAYLAVPTERAAASLSRTSSRRAVMASRVRGQLQRLLHFVRRPF